MFLTRHLIFTLMSFAFLVSTSTAQATPKVVTSIKTLQSIAAKIMQGVGTPSVIIKGTASPHDYALKPSDASLLQDADLVIWIGNILEGFLEKPVETIAHDAISLELIETEGLVLRETEDHDHGKADESHHDHKEHGKEDAHAHAEHEHKEEHAKADEKHDHGHADTDPHIWLSIDNAKIMALRISEELSRIDPENSALYSQNTKNLLEQLDVLKIEIAGQIKLIQNKKFLTFHNAYGYFEDSFDIKSLGAINVNPEVPPSAGRVRTLIAEIKNAGVSCVFSEPQFNPKVVTTLLSGQNISHAVLDPLGATLSEGPDLYPALLRGIASSMRSCLE